MKLNARALAAALCAVCLTGAASAQEGAMPAGDHAHHHHPHHGDMPAAAPVSGDSVYLIKAQLTGQNGQTFDFASLRGRPVVISMMFSNCTAVCPLIVSRMKLIDGKLDAKARERAVFVLVSFDTGRDTPAVLQQFAAKHGVDNARWRFAHASADSVREIAAVLGIRYQQLPDKSFNHSAVITLLNAEGVIVSRLDGLTEPVEPLIDKANQQP